ncbi:cytochrome aa3 quinol oxidase subunit IV [Rossellomorea aquimaris]|uniref:cytochrome aa3 quinol oxidase subunit IV n=1 Tax=Rossellomorea aquimaris TaxID=189382 RepID=UPI0007D09BFF|nr:cytochrome aa3 quinol oxidase subunit IV [Rossellomorea aquimaris]
MANSHSKFPWSHIVGFALSIVLTLIALWVALSSGFSTDTIIIIIVGLAIIQASIQLLMFMHIRESEDGKYQTATMLYAAFIAVAVVAGTIWVMSFGMDYMDMDNMGETDSHDTHMEHDMNE